MKEIGSKMSSQELYLEFNKSLQVLGIPALEPINLKAKNNSFFHRYRVYLSLYRTSLRRDWRNKEKVTNFRMKSSNALKATAYRGQI